MNTLLKNSLFSVLIATPLFLSHPALGTDSTTNWYSIYGTVGQYLFLDDQTTTNVNWFVDGSWNGTQFDVGWNDPTHGDTYPFVIERGAASGLLYLDSAERIGINTTVPAEELHISSPAPAIRLDDTTSGSGYADLDMNLHEFAIQGESGNEIVEIDTRAPSHSFFLNSSGNIGFGHIYPQRPIDVRGDGDDFAAQVYVYNINSATPGVARKLFQIVNGDGPAKFSMFAGWGDEWAFNARTDVFRISKQGTGLVEMELNQNGNLKITGTLSQGSSRTIKHDIVAVDTKKVLDQVLAMPVSEWTYNHDKDDVRHMGPMAEDFHQAFGLGDSDKKLTTVDTSGVALAAIQGLSKVVEEKDREIEALRTEMGKLRAMVQALAAKDKVASIQ